MRRIIISIEKVDGELRIILDESSHGEAEPDETAVQAAIKKVTVGVLRHFEQTFSHGIVVAH